MDDRMRNNLDAIADSLRAMDLPRYTATALQDDPFIPTALWRPGKTSPVLCAILAAGLTEDDERRIGEAMAAIPGVLIAEPLRIFCEVATSDEPTAVHLDDCMERAGATRGTPSILTHISAKDGV